MPTLKVFTGDSTLRLVVRQVRDFQFAVEGEGWKMTIDAPRALGGSVPAPCPGSLLLAALAACQMITGIDWAARQGKELRGLVAEATSRDAPLPRRVSEIKLVYRNLRAQAGDELAASTGHAMRASKLANTFKRPPRIEVVVE